MRRATTVAGAIVLFIHCSAVVGTEYAAGRPVVRIDGVAGSVQPSDLGQAWGPDAYLFIGDAVDRAVDIQDFDPGVINLWVAATPATNPYEPDESASSPTGSGLRTASFGFSQTRRRIHMYGGFAGNEESFGERDWRTNTTVLSGDLNGDDVPGSNRSDNAFHVIRIDDDALNIRVNGFTILGGQADGVEADSKSGGGLVSFGASGVLANCAFNDNFATLDGGGVAIRRGTTTASALHTTNCTFSNNTAVQQGGGMAIAGVFDFEDGVIDIVNCRFDNNTVLGDTRTGIGVGGSLFLGKVGSFPSEGPLGARVTNCTIADSSVLGPTTCSTSVCGAGGGAYVATVGGDPPIQGQFFNSIVYGNQDVISGTGQGAQIAVEGDEDRVLVEYSNIEGGWSGAGSNNIGGGPLDDPLFVGSTYRLGTGSPCIDTGTNMRALPDEFDVDDDGVSSEPAPDLDLAKRIQRGATSDTIDMGAFEFEDTCPADLNRDGSVGFADLQIHLQSQGPCPALPTPCPEDLTGNHDVGFADLTALLNAWGPCPGQQAMSSGDSNGPEAAAAMSSLLALTAQGELTPAQFQTVVDAVFVQSTTVGPLPME